MEITTQKQIRESFWLMHPSYKKGYKKNKNGNYVPKTQNDYKTDIRVCFCDWVDHLHRDGEISEKLASNVTL